MLIDKTGNKWQEAVMVRLDVPIIQTFAWDVGQV
jgi:hypothetical protein